MGVFSKAFKPYTGQYTVGTHDVEIEVPTESFGTALLTRTLKPALLMETLLLTIYYPSIPHTSSKHMQWLQRPLSQTTAGYARFLNKPKWLLLPAFWLLAGGTKLPAWMDAELADKDAAGGKEKVAGNVAGEMRERLAREGSEEDGQVSGTATLVDLEGVANGGQFPLVVFSHGLGGQRTTYSQYCGEIASRGYIVAAIEHRDGSGPITIVRQDGKGAERIVDYIKPEDLFYEPPHPILSQIDFRKEQLLMRTAEISAALSLFARINNGEGVEVTKENRRKTASLSEDFLASWKGRVDLEKEVTMAGHSFGGATTLQVLRAGSTFPFVRGITLDPWIDPIPPLTTSSSLSRVPTSSSQAGPGSPSQLGTDINVPLLVINSEAFTLWTPHYNQVRKIVEGVKEDAKSWLMTLVGSIHLSFSDFPLLQPFIASKAGSRVDSVKAIAMFVEASHELLLEDTNGKILGGKVISGDEDGAREGEGYPGRGGKPMEVVGEVRMHVRPKE